jgi:hypothetical protein
MHNVRKVDNCIHNVSFVYMTPTLWVHLGSSYQEADDDRWDICSIGLRKANGLRDDDHVLIILRNVYPLKRKHA